MDGHIHKHTDIYTYIHTVYIYYLQYNFREETFIDKFLIKPIYFIIS